MKRMAAGLWVLLALMIAGCIKMEASHEDGIIEITGGKVDVNRAVMALMRDWELTQENAGGSTTSEGKTRVGISLSSKDGLKLPAKSKHETSHLWIHARTSGGQSVQFDVRSQSKEPTVVQVTVEAGADCTTAELTRDLAQRLSGFYCRDP